MGAQFNFGITWKIGTLNKTLIMKLNKFICVSEFMCSLYSAQIWNKIVVYSSQMLLLYVFRVTIPPIIRSTCAVYGHR